MFRLHKCGFVIASQWSHGVSFSHTNADHGCVVRLLGGIMFESPVCSFSLVIMVSQLLFSAGCLFATGGRSIASRRDPMCSHPLMSLSSVIPGARLDSARQVLTLDSKGWLLWLGCATPIHHSEICLDFSFWVVGFRGYVAYTGASLAS